MKQPCCGILSNNGHQLGLPTNGTEPNASTVQPVLLQPALRCSLQRMSIPSEVTTVDQWSTIIPHRWRFDAHIMNWTRELLGSCPFASLYATSMETPVYFLTDSSVAYLIIRKGGPRQPSFVSTRNSSSAITLRDFITASMGSYKASPPHSASRLFIGARYCY